MIMNLHFHSTNHHICDNEKHSGSFLDLYIAKHATEEVRK